MERMKKLRERDDRLSCALPRAFMNPVSRVSSLVVIVPILFLVAAHGEDTDSSKPTAPAVQVRSLSTQPISPPAPSLSPIQKRQFELSAENTVRDEELRKEL